MTYDIYRFIFFGGAVLAGLCLAISVILFFRLRIPNVIGDLTGSNARKAIENIRNQNRYNNGNTYKSDPERREQNNLNDSTAQSGSLVKNNNDLPDVKIVEPKINSESIKARIPQPFEAAAPEKNVSNETTVLGIDCSAETTVLYRNTVDKGLNDDGSFVIEQEITFISTDEIIA